MKPQNTLKSPLRIQRGGADFLSMDTILHFINRVLKPNIKEQITLLPDSIFVGSLMLALLTQSYAMAMFSVSLLEAGLIGAGIRKLFTYLDLVHTAPERTNSGSACFSSYTTPTLESFITFSSSNIESAFPSGPLFILSTAAAYIVGSMYNQKEELEALGPAYSARFYIALFASSLLLLAVSMYRFANSCEGLGIILVSILFGILIGGLVLFQNNQLFGRDATNLTGIPLLRERTRDGKPLYICPQKTSETSS